MKRSSENGVWAALFFAATLGIMAQVGGAVLALSVFALAVICFVVMVAYHADLADRLGWLLHARAVSVRLASTEFRKMTSAPYEGETENLEDGQLRP